MKTIFLKLRFLKLSILILVLTLALGTSLTAQAKAVQFNILKSTPVGSSQTREEINTNHKGKQTGTVFKTSLVDKEIRNGQPHYWIEMRMQTLKISKKGKRKNTGKPAIMKSLVAESTKPIFNSILLSLAMKQSPCLLASLLAERFRAKVPLKSIWSSRKCASKVIQLRGCRAKCRLAPLRLSAPAWLTAKAAHFIQN